MGRKSRAKASGENWSHDHHASRLSKKIDKQKKQEEGKDEVSLKKGYHRSMLLSHDNYEKREEGKMRLHISKAKREIEALRTRLKAWDDVSEVAAFKKRREEEEKKRKREEEESAPGYKRKRRGRLGPETWKLRGGARPAWEVYDFDTRYIDPHIKAHQEALERTKRSVNAFHVCKGNFGKDVDDNDEKLPHSELMVETCRKFIATSMQLAMVALEARKFKTARESLLEIIDLEGVTTLNPITNARCKLMRMYLEANRPDSARRLWEKLPPDYSSVWIRYSAALLEFVSWKVLEEKGSTEKSAEDLLVQAIRGNVYCAYYIAFNETFHNVMEYTDDVEDAEDGTIEQAIEYCNSEEMGNWIGTEGAVEWIRGVILRTLNSRQDTGNEDDNRLMLEDLEWENKLANLEKDYEEQTKEENNPKEEEDEDEEDADEEQVDLLMFTGMFRTGMDMLSDAGEFNKLE